MDLTNIIKGLHHVTATVVDAQEDYDFYVKLLGQRLIKETVNFDNENVYHFYYGNRIGSPSTIFTTFPYGDQNVKKGVIGSGQVYETVFSAPSGSLNFWKQRLKTNHVEIATAVRFGKEYITFEDPSGLKLSIREDNTDNRVPVWTTDEISETNAIKGIHSVVLAVENVNDSEYFMKAFGYQTVEKEGSFTFMETAVKGAGNTVYLLDAKAESLPKGINGLGTVHHVAHRVESVTQSKEIKEKLVKEFGIQVTEVKDRKYFKSIYFRMPGGVIFEIATEGPGFQVDEEEENLGTSLKLPEWQEPRREQIEAGLKPYKK
ncbi:MAG: ring-cleaving dioxygenase [Balneolia bacterium]|nr:ring-cleaving dioxygenase [Balneolia bacterium]